MSVPRRKAYLVTIPEMVVIADDEREVRYWVENQAPLVARTRLLDADELRKRGDDYPLGSWDPDRELTCEEIADEMAAVRP